MKIFETVKTLLFQNINYQLALETVKKNGLNIQTVAKKYQSDDKIIKTAINENIDSYFLLSPNLKKEYVLYVLKKESNLINKVLFQTPELLNDKDFFIKAIKIIDQSASFFLLNEMSREIQSNFEAGKEAVKIYGNNLALLSTELKANKDIVKTAVKERGSALSSASDELKNDDSIVLDAIYQDPMALANANERFKSNKILVYKCVSREMQKNKIPWNYFANDFKDLKELIENATNINVKFYSFVNAELSKDFNLAKKCIKKDGYQLLYTYEEFLSNKELVLLALKNTLEIAPVLPEEIKKIIGENKSSMVYNLEKYIESTNMYAQLEKKVFFNFNKN